MIKKTLFTIFAIIITLFLFDLGHRSLEVFAGNAITVEQVEPLDEVVLLQHTITNSYFLLTFFKLIIIGSIFYFWIKGVCIPLINKTKQ